MRAENSGSQASNLLGHGAGRYSATARAYFKWQQAFAAFLQKNYHYGMVVGCYRESSLTEAQSELKTLEDTFRPTRKIIETGWEYK